MVINGIHHFKKAFAKTLSNDLLIHLMQNLRNGTIVTIGKYDFNPTGSDIAILEEVMKTRKFNIEVYVF